MWLLEQDAILTKDNMLKRNWLGDPTCYFCSESESRDHLFFQCSVSKVVWGMVGTCLGANNIPRDLTQYYSWIKTWLPNGGLVHTFGLVAVCWAIWKSRNRACFDKKVIKHPAEILIQASAFMKYWAGLYKAEFQEQLLDGVKALLSCAQRVLAQQGPPMSHPQLPAPPGDTEDSEDDEAWSRWSLFLLSSTYRRCGRVYPGLSFCFCFLNAVACKP